MGDEIAKNSRILVIISMFSTGRVKLILSSGAGNSTNIKISSNILLDGVELAQKLKFDLKFIMRPQSWKRVNYIYHTLVLTSKILSRTSSSRK